MSRATLAVQAATVAGIAITFTAPNGTGSGNGNTFTHKNSAPAVLLVKNDDDSAHVITIPANGRKFRGVSMPDFSKSVAAGATVAVWVPPDLYSNGSGICAVDIDDATDVTWAAVKFPASLFA